MKKAIFVLSLLLFIFIIPVGVKANDLGVDQELKNKIVIRNMDDLNEMNDRAVKRYDEMLKEIPQSIKEKYNRLKEGDMEAKAIANGYCLKVDTSITLEDFLLAYPEYRRYDKNKLEEEINLLRFNPVVSAVRAFFEKKGYKLSLTFFNHSLTPNPEDSTLDMIGHTDGMYGYIKELLDYDGFIDEMIKFSKAGSNYKTISNSSDWEFNDGDLKWAIHGFTWKRTRTRYDKAYFKIIDVYDFNKWKDIPGIVAGLAGTKDFNIELYGLVENGKLQ